MIFPHNASDFLYRDISTVTGNPNVLSVCRTSTQSPDLAARVQRFEVSRPATEPFIQMDPDFVPIGDVLLCPPNLRSLTLKVSRPCSYILAGCTFKIEEFTYFLVCNHSFVYFLNGQPQSMAISLSRPRDGLNIPPTCVPKLTKIHATISWLAELTPGHPVKEVIFEGGFSTIPESFDMSFRHQRFWLLRHCPLALHYSALSPQQKLQYLCQLLKT